ncbi:MAG: glycosyltransferase [Candidatus Scalindua sp.]|nr:glycosyltransferase [Candidatus Scalindua sp.]
MKILFLTHSYPNYVPDLLLHGLRKLLGENVIDYPKKECLYWNRQTGTFPELYHEPFWFPKDTGEVDRDDLETKLKKNYFDYLVCDVRTLSSFMKLYGRLNVKHIRIIIIDGEDFPVKINPGPYVICRRETDGADYSIPLPMALPEEIYNCITSFDNNPKTYSIGFLGSVGKQSESRRALIEDLASHYPDTLLQTTPILCEGDNRPDKRVGLKAYYDTLQRCRLVLTLRGAGYDTFRFWENAACNALHVSEIMPLFIPNVFNDRQHIMQFSHIDELRRIIDNHLTNSNETEQVIRNGRKHLKNYHLTTKRAGYFLDRIKRAFSV